MNYERIDEFEIKKLDMIDETFQARQDYDEKKIENLSNDIKKYGQREPIGIRKSPKKKGKYQVIFGFQRVKAVQKFKKDSIQAYVYRGLTERECQELSVRDNEMHGDLMEMEKALQCFNLKENGWSIEDLCESYNTKKSTIYNWLKIAKCDDWMQGLLNYGFLTPYHVLEIMRFKEESKRMELVKDVLQFKWSVRDLKQKIKGKPFIATLYKKGWVTICPEKLTMVDAPTCEECEHHFLTIRKKAPDHSSGYDCQYYCSLSDDKMPSGGLAFWKRYNEIRRDKKEPDWSDEIPDAKNFDEKDLQRELGNRKVLSVDEWVEISRRLEKSIRSSN